MCTIILTLALASVNCSTPRPSAVDSARILEQSPALSNRTHVYTLTPQDAPPLFVPSHVAPPAPTTERTEQSRAIRMGIPGGWTPLEWAILHGGAR